MLNEKELLHLSKSSSVNLQLIERGASIESRAGMTVTELRAKLVRDRIALADGMLMSARSAMLRRPADFRSAISRWYYAMYHTFRAVVFFSTGGDEHEEHSKLPQHLPVRFPNRAAWENKLKNARTERNRADYDPYPLPQSAFATAARELRQDAQAAQSVAKNYLLSEGWKP